MQLWTRQTSIALLLTAPLLAGCLERGQPTMVDTSADDDAFCRANNVAAGRTTTSSAARTATCSAAMPMRVPTVPSETSPSRC